MNTKASTSKVWEKKAGLKSKFKSAGKKKVIAKRRCKICNLEQPPDKFNTGPSGRMKSICNDCIKTILSSYYGEGNLRKCSSCGRITIDYRCSRCWKAVRDDSDGLGADPDYI